MQVGLVGPMIVPLWKAKLLQTFLAVAMRTPYHAWIRDNNKNDGNPSTQKRSGMLFQPELGF